MSRKVLELEALECAAFLQVLDFMALEYRTISVPQGYLEPMRLAMQAIRSKPCCAMVAKLSQAVTLTREET